MKKYLFIFSFEYDNYPLKIKSGMKPDYLTQIIEAPSLRLALNRFEGMHKDNDLKNPQDIILQISIIS